MRPRRHPVGIAAPPGPRVAAAPRTVWTWIAPATVALAALLVYANSLGNGFVWDDPIILTRQLVVFRSVGDVLAPPRDIPQFSPDYYRPLTIATYLLDRAIGGDDPFVFHLSVVLAHAATSLLLYLLAQQLLSGPGARLGAFAAGALFALHPIHTESVAWAAGRSDVLATGFLVAALVVSGRRLQSWRGSLLAGICAAAALGAKETAVAFYPLMLLRELLAPPTPRPAPGERLRRWAGPLVAGVVYVLLRRNALGEFVGSAPDALPTGERSALDLLGAVGMYVGRLLWPVNLNAYIDRIDSGPLTLALALVLLAGAGGAAWFWWSARPRARANEASGTRAARAPRRGGGSPGPRPLEPSRPGLPLFALAWLVLTLAPSLAILWKIPDAPLAERYLYLPSAGFCLLVGDLVGRAWAATTNRPARLATAGGLAVMLLASAIGTVRRNPVWHDDIALWEDTERKSFASGMAARSVGTAYLQAGRRAEARAAFQRALDRRNSQRGVQTIYNNLGTLAMYDADYAAAQRHYEAALQANPGADTIFNLGLAILQRGGLSQAAAQAALPYYQRAQGLNPHDPDIEAALAQAYGILGQRELAAQHARRALELGATGPTADTLRAMLQ
jgi:Flp pilus assembly protein TadD